MVISAETASRPPGPPTRSSVAASTTEVSAGTFSFPVLKTWGNRRAFRFAALKSTGGGVADSGYGLKNADDVPVDGIGHPTCNGTAIQEVGEKLLGPPPTDADESEDGGKPEPTSEAEPSPSAARTWNLRTRRRSGAGIPSGNDRYLGGSSPEKRTARPKFSIALTREEIDEDIYAVTGHRARRRPRKRPRAVQRHVDPLLPGSCLSEITVDSYRVPE